MELILTAAITSIGPTLVGLGAWYNARQAKAQTNGLLHEPIREIREAVTDLAAEVRAVKADVREIKRGAAADRASSA